MVLAAAWHPSDTPCLAYFCLVTLQDTGAAISDQFTVEVTKYNPPFQVSPDADTDPNLYRSAVIHVSLFPFILDVHLIFHTLFLNVLFPQSEEALQSTRLVLPRSPGSTAFLYNEELVFACSTGTSRGGLPDEKICFNSPGEKRELSSLKKNALWHQMNKHFLFLYKAE